MRYIGAATTEPAETDAAMARWEGHWERHGFGLLAAEDRGTRTLVGRGGVQYHRAWPHDPEVGWAVDPEWWGRGIASEMGAAFVEWAHGELGFPRLVSITVEENLASRRVMEKLGFAFLTTVPGSDPGVALQVYSLTAPLD
jgi:RimJ/RimL family protein N-acetyltransferase